MEDENPTQQINDEMTVTAEESGSNRSVGLYILGLVVVVALIVIGIVSLWGRLGNENAETATAPQTEIEGDSITEAPIDTATLAIPGEIRIVPVNSAASINVSSNPDIPASIGPLPNNVTLSSKVYLIESDGSSNGCTVGMVQPGLLFLVRLTPRISNSSPPI